MPVKKNKVNLFRVTLRKDGIIKVVEQSVSNEGSSEKMKEKIISFLKDKKREKNVGRSQSY